MRKIGRVDLEWQRFFFHRYCETLRFWSISFPSELTKERQNIQNIAKLLAKFLYSRNTELFEMIKDRRGRNLAHVLRQCANENYYVKMVYGETGRLDQDGNL